MPCGVFNKTLGNDPHPMYHEMKVQISLKMEVTKKLISLDFSFN